MTSESRKLKRNKKKEAEKELKKKLGLFQMIPDHCLVCQAPFDKKNREQVMSWSVVVRKTEKIVRLYCPSCWDKAKQLVKETEHDSKDKEV